MTQDYPRILVVTGNNFNLVTGGGITLTNLFRGWPADRLANLHDRFIRTFLDHHGVVDFIVVNYWPGKRRPAFNIADAALVAGVLLFMIYLRRHGDQADVPALAPPAA